MENAILEADELATEDFFNLSYSWYLFKGIIKKNFSSIPNTQHHMSIPAKNAFTAKPIIYILLATTLISLISTLFVLNELEYYQPKIAKRLFFQPEHPITRAFSLAIGILLSVGSLFLILFVVALGRAANRVLVSQSRETHVRRTEFFPYYKYTNLLPFHKDKVYVKQVPLYNYGIEFGARMTVVKLKDGSLFIYSPVDLDEKTKKSLDELGKVKYVIAPTVLHHFFINQYKKAYPNAKFYAAPGLEKHRKDFKFDEVLKEDKKYPWSDELSHSIFYVIKNGKEFSEVVFCHHETKTLMVCDLIENMGQPESPFMTKLFLWIALMYETPSTPVDLKIISDPKVIGVSAKKVLKWDFDTIILAHGRLIEEGGKELFRDCMAFVLDPYDKKSQ